MKKTAKIVLLVCGISLFLFLLLPFLETKAPNAASKQDAPKADPQIFTSNPLTELVGRIARFFKTRQTAEEQTRKASQPITADQANEMFGQPQGDTLYASAQGAANAYEGGAFSGDGAAYADAYLQNEDGEWVLIRQTAPEGSTRGMHEINAKDNAYDRYITQERQARFTPVMRLPAVREEVPDSKLARVFNPIKRFFGFNEKPAASHSMQGEQDSFSAGKLASSSGIEKNKEKSSTLPKLRTVNWNGFRNNPVTDMEPGGTDAAEALLNLILPDAELKNVADWLADIKYPNANDDPQAEQDKQNFAEQWKEEKKQQANQAAAKIMEEKAAEHPEENALSVMITESCGDKVVSVKKTSCDISDTPEQEPIQEYQELNARHFYEKTNLRLPPAGITAVLQKTDKELPTVDMLNQERADWELPPLSPETQQAVEMYHFMQESCPNCYWVATGAGPAQELQKTIQAAGMTLKGDPLQRHQEYIDAYIEQQRADGKTAEELQELREQLESNPTPYTAYTREDLQQLHQDTLNLLLERAKPEDAQVPFFIQADSANQYYNETGRKHPMFYGTGTAVSGEDLQQRSQALTNDIADFVNSWRPIIQEIKQEASQEGTTDLVRPKVRQIREDLQKDMQNFNATNDIGTYQK